MMQATVQSNLLEGLLKMGRGIALLATLVVGYSLAGAVSWNGLKLLDLFWQGVVPLVPLILLLAPHFWRRICPVATLNLAGARARHESGCRPAVLPPKAVRFIKRFGIVAAAFLLWLVVPARLLLFNQSPYATLFLILAIALAAVMLGALGQWKAAWCSSLCPIYPVEKLYGAAPIWEHSDARCVPQHAAQNCYRCALNCLDVPETETHYWGAMRKAGAKHSNDAMRRFFLGSFPGFIAAYWSFANPGGIARNFIGVSALSVYTTFALFMVASYACYQMFEKTLKHQYASDSVNRRLELIVILVALNLYYLASSFGLAVIVSHISHWQDGQGIIRVGIMTVVLIVSSLWVRRAWRSEHPGSVHW